MDAVNLKPYYDENGITIYHGDCREIAPVIEYDAVVSDPPYGMNWNTDSRRFSGGSINRYGSGKDHGPIEGDSTPFDPTPWLDAGWVVLFGANHFAQRLPKGTTLVWIKRDDDHFGTFLSDAEVAWRKGGCGVYCFRKQFPPPSRMAELGRDHCPHPTQKPVALMNWCIERSGAPQEAIILDPYMGLGTTLVACRDRGQVAIGIEIEEKYCEIAAKRLAQGVLDFG